LNQCDEQSVRVAHAIHDHDGTLQGMVTPRCPSPAACSYTLNAACCALLTLQLMESLYFFGPVMVYVKSAYDNFWVSQALDPLYE
jgi:hypothetical protein